MCIRDRQDVRAAYRDNVSYLANGSPGQARLFITACGLLIDRLQNSVTKAGNRVDKEVALYERQMVRAQQWLAVNGAPGTVQSGVIAYDFSGFRQ